MKIEESQNSDARALLQREPFLLQRLIIDDHLFRVGWTQLGTSLIKPEQRYRHVNSQPAFCDKLPARELNVLGKKELPPFAGQTGIHLVANHKVIIPAEEELPRHDVAASVRIEEIHDVRVRL